MEGKVKVFLDEAIKLERNMSKLYKTYSELYLKDSELWIKLSYEEEEHAQFLENIGIMLEDYTPKVEITGLEELQITNKEIEQYIKNVYLGKVKKEDAYKFAYKIEDGAAEFHHHKFLSKYTKEEIKEAFLKLSKYDEIHSKIIREIIGNYLNEK